MLMHLGRAIIVEHLRAAAYALTKASAAQLRLSLMSVGQYALINLLFECVEALAEFAGYVGRALRLYLDNSVPQLLLLLGDGERGRHRELFSLLPMLDR